MNIVALLVAAFLQLASLSFDQLRQTIDTIATALAQQYVDAFDGKRHGDLLTHDFEHAAGDEAGRAGGAGGKRKEPGTVTVPSSSSAFSLRLKP